MGRLRSNSPNEPRSKDRMTMSSLRTWYVVADSGSARILTRRVQQAMFDTHTELTSSEIHSHTHDLGAERPGRSHESANAAHHAVEPRQDLHRAGKRAFIENVAEVLNDANRENAFDGLILAAPAHALGDLKHALDASTKLKVVFELQKDLTHVPNAALSEHFAALIGG
jgi:protein required for attachment to host cells